MNALIIIMSVLTGSSHAPPVGQTFCDMSAWSTPRPSRPSLPSEHLGVGGTRQLSAGLGAFPGLYQSEQIAIQWGDLGPGVSEAQIAQLAEALEDIAAGYLGEGYWSRVGASTHFLNVYLANSGGLAPEMSFLNAYVWMDEDGYPYMVIHPGLLDQPTYPAVYLQEVLAHEYFHVLQVSTNAFADRFTTDGWFFEASAMWAAGLLVNEQPLAPGAAASALLTPQYPLDFFESTDGVAAGRWYGLWLFSDFLAARGYASLMKDIWLTSGADEGVLLAHDRLLASYDGTSLATHFGDYAVSNVRQQYEYAAEIDVAIANVARSNGIAEETIAAQVSGQEEEFAKVEGDDAPGAYGYSVILWDAPATERIVARVVGADGAAFAIPIDARLVISSASAPQNLPLVLQDGVAVAEVRLPSDTTAVRLVVAALPDQWSSNERFAFSYFLGDASRDPDRALDDADAGCGCRSNSADNGLLYVLVGLALWWRLRARTHVAT